MAGSKDFLDQAAAIAKALRGLGFEPVLVGGMALVILGSRRVTRDFDFVIAQPADRIRIVPITKITTTSGRGRPLAAIQTAHRVGQSSSSAPIGLSSRISRS